MLEWIKGLFGKGTIWTIKLPGWDPMRYEELLLDHKKENNRAFLEHCRIALENRRIDLDFFRFTLEAQRFLAEINLKDAKEAALEMRYDLEKVRLAHKEISHQITRVAG